MLYFLIIALPALAMAGFPSSLRTCPTNEHYVSCVRDHCRPRTCSDLGKALNCSITLSAEQTVTSRNEPCEGGCVCRDYFVRNDEGKCVYEEACPEPPPCPDNEKFEPCAPAHCAREHCRDIGHHVLCAQVQGYHPGACFCKRGYLRHQGVCIPQETCPGACTEPHGQIVGCKRNCKHTECASLGYEIDPRCVPQLPDGDYCDVGCLCEDGYLWKRDRCVLREQCDDEAGDH